MAESEEELKSLLMKVNDQSGKARLKLNIKKNYFGVLAGEDECTSFYCTIFSFMNVQDWKFFCSL